MSLVYSDKIIDKINSYTTLSNRDKIDRLLEIDATQYTNLGKDSSKTQKELVKRNSKYIYKVIKSIDVTLGNMFLQHQDK
jgi:hypothetical protein|tara:strand:- start:1066 stop:1305 length:240 start_codon:yes stop_codon:yes gene_type:complete